MDTDEEEVVMHWASAPKYISIPISQNIPVKTILVSLPEKNVQKGFSFPKEVAIQVSIKVSI
ncbi:hypothetical protein GCM10028807_51300 [Spirosoma daeguense]